MNRELKWMPVDNRPARTYKSQTASPWVFEVTEPVFAKPESVKTVHLLCYMAGDIVFKIPESGLLIGSGTDCDIILEKDRTVSRKHAKIEMQNGKMTLQDEGSTNHTYVDGKELEAPVQLESGQSFRIASRHWFKYLEEETADA